MIDIDDILRWIVIGFVVILILFIIFLVWNIFIGNRSAGYILENGESIHCENFITKYCGMSLYDCDNGKSYSCLTNVQIIKED